MEFMTAHYRGQGAKVSLLVQHYEYEGEQICFACLCSESYVSERLLRWFRDQSLKKLFEGGERRFSLVEKQLRRQIERTERELKKSAGNIAGILCVGEDIMIFCRGEFQILLLNMAFGRGHLERVKFSAEQLFTYGVLQQNVALLLTTDTFCHKVTERMLREALFVEELREQWQMQKHLRELGEEGRRLGGSNMAAVLVRSVCRTDENSFRSKVCSEEAFLEKHSVREAERKAVSAREERVVREEEGEISEQTTALLQKELRQRGFQCIRVLGEGAFSKVCLVEGRRDKKLYACKVAQNSVLLSREFELLSRLIHPLFPEVYDFWQGEQSSFLLMEYVAGSNLAQMLSRRGAFSVAQTLRMGMELAEGLLQLHEWKTPMVFRDVKPENIMIRQDGVVKLLDFGCAVPLGITPGSIAGSVGYAAPEQFEKGKVLEANCDVYALGRTLLEALGQSPVKEQQEGSTKAQKKRMHKTRQSRMCKAQQERRLRKALTEVLKACTRKNPSERIPDMRSLMALLMDLLEEAHLRRAFVKRHICGKKKVRWDILCHKNIWESEYKNS